MKRILTNKEFLFKLAFFMIFVLLYLLFNRLDTRLEEKMLAAASTHIITLTYIVHFIQRSLLGVLFYLLALKQKPVFHFSKASFILFLCLAFLSFPAIWIIFINIGLFDLTSQYYKFFSGLLSEFDFFNFIIPSLAGFFLIQSLITAPKTLDPNERIPYEQI